MRKVKLILALALAGALSVSGLAACGSKKTEETKAASTTEAVKTEAAASEAAETEAVTSEAAETKASAAEGYDLDAVFQGILDKLENADSLKFFPTDNMDKIKGLYVGIGDIDFAQIKLFTPPVTGYACEIMLVEVKNAEDVKAVQDVLQARIDSAINGGACDTTSGAIWEKNAQIQTSGNLVGMIVLPDDYTIPENIFE